MNLEETLASLSNTGLISAVEEVPFLTDEPKIYACAARSSGQDHKGPGETQTFGYGYSRSRVFAAVKACAECLERLSLSHVPGEQLGQGNYRAVEGAVDPALFVNHPASETGRGEIMRRARSEALYWWPAVDRILERRCMIPAQMAFLRTFQEEVSLRQQHISTGGALGETGAGRAFRAGLFEIVERDASISAYLKRRPLRRITGLPEDAERLAAYLRRYQLEPAVLDAATDLGVPAVVVVTVDRSGVGPAVNIGCRAAENYGEAICGAMLESIQARRSLRLSALRDDVSPSEEIVSYQQRVRLWSPVERIADLDFWLASSAEVRWEELKGQTVMAEDAVKRLAHRGYHVFTADVTLPEVRAQGFEVLRVVVPELHALYLDERCKVMYSRHHGVIADDPSLLPHPIT